MTIALPGGVVTIAIVVLAFVLAKPDKAQIVAGWVWRFFSLLWRGADRKAVAYHVQGTVNDATSAVMKTNPSYILKGKLRIKWTTADEAGARMRDGDVVVFMQKASSPQQNVTRALTLYLQKAVIRVGRRYVDRETMMASDLVLAKAILTEGSPNACSLDDFYEEHMNRACRDPEIEKRVRQLDDIDVHGWLGRVLLAEFYHLGLFLQPAEPREAWRAEARAFADWLHRLSERQTGDKTVRLTFKGQLIHVSMVFVATRAVLEHQGLGPYRQYTKRLLYQQKVDAVYLMGRDDNIDAVRAIAASLKSDGRIASQEVYEYPLRRDFVARKSLKRERAILVCLRRRRQDEASVVDFEAPEGFSDEEVYDFDSIRDDLQRATGEVNTGVADDEAVAPTHELSQQGTAPGIAIPGAGGVAKWG